MALRPKQRIYMTERELLELAAKAAGYVIDEHATNGSAWAWVYPLGAKPDGDGEYPIFKWNPLTDDGDALRLAVKTGEPFVVRTSCVTTMGGLVEGFDPAMPGDDLRATRRAIVRAAAEIGKALKVGQHGIDT